MSSPEQGLLRFLQQALTSLGTYKEEVGTLEREFLERMRQSGFTIAADGTITLTGGHVIPVTIADGSITNAKLAADAVTDVKVAAAAAIAWSKISKAGSSLADLATRSASDLSSGTLPDARFPATLPAASGANLTALNADQLTTGIIPAARFGLADICDGRLTLTTAVPVTSSDVSGASATTVYFTPYKGNRVALYDGATKWTVYAFTEKSIALPAAASQMYDVFIYDNAGTPALELLAWTNDTTRATALTTQDGVLVKSGATTRRYLGSVRTTTVAGQSEDSLTKRLLWNYYHRVPRSLQVIDTTNTWNYTTATWRQANASTANQVAVVIGVAESVIDLLASHQATNTLGTEVATGIGEDSTSSPMTSVRQTASATSSQYGLPCAHVKKIPAVGYHFYAWLEWSTASGTTTWLGDNGTTTTQTGMTGQLL